MEKLRPSDWYLCFFWWAREAEHLILLGQFERWSDERIVYEAESFVRWMEDCLSDPQKAEQRKCFGDGACRSVPALCISGLGYPTARVARRERWLGLLRNFEEHCSGSNRVPQELVAGARMVVESMKADLALPLWMKVGAAPPNGSIAGVVFRSLDNYPLKHERRSF